MISNPTLFSKVKTAVHLSICRLKVSKTFEVTSVQDAEMAGQHRPQGSLEAAENQQLFHNAIIIHTISSGYNSGRSYYLKANSEPECSKIMADLSVYIHAARKRAESKSKFAKLQRRVRRVYNSKIFQGFAIFCIILVSMSS